MKRFEIRLEPELFAAIERLAHHERRTINQQMLVLLAQGLVAERYKRVLPASSESAASSHAEGR